MNPAGPAGLLACAKWRVCGALGALPQALGSGNAPVEGKQRGGHATAFRRPLRSPQTTKPQSKPSRPVAAVPGGCAQRPSLSWTSKPPPHSNRGTQYQRSQTERKRQHGTQSCHLQRRSPARARLRSKCLPGPKLLPFLCPQRLKPRTRCTVETWSAGEAFRVAPAIHHLPPIEGSNRPPKTPPKRYSGSINTLILKKEGH